MTAQKKEQTTKKQKNKEKMKVTYTNGNEQTTVDAKESSQSDSAGEHFITSTCPYCGYENVIGAEADTCLHFDELTLQ